VRRPENHDPEPLIEAVTALDWSTHHASEAVLVIQSAAQTNFGAEFSEDDAFWWLTYLVDQHLISSRIHPDDKLLQLGWTTTRRRRAKYVRVPLDERD